ncbi:hypothetical protein AB3S75_008137 [Citrus x aurantiifolia]
MWSATTRPQPQGYRGHGFCQKGLEAMVMQLIACCKDYALFQH